MGGRWGRKEEGSKKRVRKTEVEGEGGEKRGREKGENKDRNNREEQRNC